MASDEFDYNKYLLLLKKNKRLFIAVALAIMTIVTVYSYMLPPVYEARSTVFIEKSVISELFKGLAVTPSVEDKTRALTYALNSRTLIAKVIAALDLDINKNNKVNIENIINKLQKNTQIKVQDKEGLFTISFQSENPKLSRDYVNTLVRKYIEGNSSIKRGDAEDATNFIADQLNTVKQKLEKADAEINNFKRSDGSVASMDPAMLLKEIDESQQHIDDLRIRQSQLETSLAALANSSGPGPANPNLLALQKKLEDLQRLYTDNYPEIINTKNEISALQEQMKASPKASRVRNSPEHDKLAAELRVLRQSEANLQGIVSNNRRLLQNIPSARARLDELEREKTSQKNLFDQLASRKGQSEVSNQLELQDKSTSFRVVDPAVMPTTPVSPNRVKIILIGIFAGIAGSFGLLLVKDTMDHSIKDVDAARSLGVPLIATIPRIDDPLVVASQAKGDRRLYILSGAYFAIIVSVLLMELFNITVLADMIKKTSLL